MKRLAILLVLSTGMFAGPAMADHGGRNLLNRENIGGAIGAALGGLAGNKIVEGKGQPAATAAGAVGGFLIGKNIAHNYDGPRYSDPGPAVSYRRTSGYRPSKSYRSGNSYEPRGCCGYDSGPEYGVRPIHETFVATCTSNVRAGPSTRYHVIDQVYERERVRVIGKVRGRNWFKVRVGHRTGFIYAPLLRPAHYGYSGGSDW